ncbi:MAG: hypothetical protein A2148_09170 [Chloroflexi bacterium RBG_16_68_14]|nr:MAG: hypothetical protein A2148_09170 [Chloroflexi bacterium RBG_16_68_14]
MGSSLSYDRVADIYDATRSLPEDVARKLTDALLAELSVVGADRALEVGIGTGRIARPLAERGMRVCGIDIAPRMLARLREQLGPGHLPPDLVLGDATRLPIRSGSFRAVLAVHVLHLVSSLERAAGELRRVLGPGGVLFRSHVRYGGEPHWDAGGEKWDELIRARSFVPRRSPRPAEIRDALRAVGGSYRTEPYGQGEDRRTPGENLDRIRRRIDSWSWEIPDDLFADCLREFEPWYRRHYGDMDLELAQPLTYEVEVWSFA